MVLTAYGALSPVNRAFLPPSPAQCASIVAKLMRRRGIRTTRFRRPRTTPSSVGIAHVHRIPCPTFRDDREAPLLSGRDARISRNDLPDGLSEIFLAKGLDGTSEARGVICLSGRLGRHMLCNDCAQFDATRQGPGCESRGGTDNNSIFGEDFGIHRLKYCIPEIVHAPCYRPILPSRVADLAIASPASPI
jgi:hypothetical protein